MTDPQAYRPGAAPPTKLFREPAKLDGLSCPSCGGSIQLKSFGQREQVTCSYCGSTLSPDQSGALALAQKAQRERRESALPLYARGALEGVEWEIIGIVWRECKDPYGVAYPWQEFLLFNPYAGYRWLVFSMTDAHWSLGQALPGAPLVSRDDDADWGSTQTCADYEGEVYRHFQRSEAYVTYVEGEFPWQVRAGDKATMDDYVAPPYGISIERTAGESGEDLQFTRSRHVEAAEVWEAFKPGGSPTRPTGIGMLQPNPWHATTRVTWISCGVLMALWLVFSIGYGSGRELRSVKSIETRAHETVSERLTIGTKGEHTSIQVDLSSTTLDNSWAFAEVMLVNLDTEEAIGLGAEVSEYSGPGWREVDRNGTMRVNGVPGGEYLLQATFQASQPKPWQASIVPVGPNLDDIFKDIGIKSKIYGTISEAGGPPLKDAQLSLHCTCLQGIKRTKTNAAGMYQFNDLPSGTYVLRARAGEGEVRKTLTLNVIDEQRSFSMSTAKPDEASMGIALPVTKDGAKPETSSSSGVPGLPPDKLYMKDLRVTLRVYEDVFFWRYVLFPLLFILGFPLFAAFQPSRFEAKRWMNSDHG